MTKTSIGLDDRLQEYLLSVSFRDQPVLRELREVTARLPMSRMQISPEQGQFMYLLAKLIQARSVLEVGTFTGYSALCMAMALPDSGRIVTCDINEETTRIACEYWQKAGVDDRIELKLGSATETLQSLIDADQGDSFDLMFIDADKTEYQKYFDLGLRLIRPGGVILIDNVLWDGQVADPAFDDDDTRALREFNKTLHSDQRVEICMLPLADGLTLSMKLPD